MIQDIHLISLKITHIKPAVRIFLYIIKYIQAKETNDPILLIFNIRVHYYQKEVLSIFQ